MSSVELSHQTLNVKKWLPETLHTHPRILVVGKRGSGKSHVIHDLITNFNRPTTIVAPSDRLQGFYATHQPEARIFYKVDDLPREEFETQDLPRTLVIDDGFSTKDRIGDHFFDLSVGSQTALIVGIQFPYLSTEEMRSFTHVIMMAEDFTSNQKRLYDRCAGFFKGFEDFAITLDQLTQDWGALVVDQTRPAFVPLEEKVFWYRVDLAKVHHLPAPIPYASEEAKEGVIEEEVVVEAEAENPTSSPKSWWSWARFW